MKEHGTFLVPTLSSALRVPSPEKVPPYLYQKKTLWSQIARDHLEVALSAGVKVALGTDAGVCPHGQNLTELGHLVDLGLRPWQALQAGTANAAELMRLSADLGTLEQGKLADLVVTTKHPFRNIHDLAVPDSIRAVVQGGHVKKDLDEQFAPLAA